MKYAQIKSWLLTLGIGVLCTAIIIAGLLVFGRTLIAFGILCVAVGLAIILVMSQVSMEGNKK